LGTGSLEEAEAGLARALGLGASRPGIGGRLAGALFGLIPNSATIDDTGVRVGGVTRPWAEIGLSYETENLFCFVLTRTSGPITLPKRAMTESELQVVRTLATEHVTTTPETLDRLTEIRTRGRS
jgi:hypothetical protein